LFSPSGPSPYNEFFERKEWFSRFHRAKVPKTILKRDFLQMVGVFSSEEQGGSSVSGRLSAKGNKTASQNPLLLMKNDLGNCKG